MTILTMLMAMLGIKNVYGNESFLKLIIKAAETPSSLKAKTW